MNIFMEVLGIFAMVLILLGYFLISTEKVTSRSVLYQVLNVVGSLIFVVYLSLKNAWAAVALNGAWSIIGLVALISIYLKRHKEKMIEQKKGS